jgi:hypothetical protein
VILAAAGAFALKRALAPPAAAPAAPAAPAALLDLTYAELRDRDASGDASAGDEVVLQLGRAMQPGTDVPLSRLPLVAPDDHWGEGATVSVGASRRKAVAAGPPREIHVVLGRGARLRLYGTYRPGTSGSVPAQVRAVDGPLPILVHTSERRAFVGDRFPDVPGLRAYYGQLHAHTSLSDGVLLPRDAYAMARRWGLDFFAVTDHLEQLGARGWEQERAEADAATEDGAFVALAGYEWGGAPSAQGWINHVNVLGSDRMLGLMGSMTVGGLYESLGALAGDPVVGQFNHPGMARPVVGSNDWDDFAYSPAADLRLKQVMVATHSPNEEDNRETAGYIPALDQGWHLSPKGEEDNHTANWGRTRVRTGLWLDTLSRPAVLAGLLRMAGFYTDDPQASVRLVADGRWLMGSTVYGDAPHRLDVEVLHRGRVAAVSRVELVTRGGAVHSSHAGGTTPLRVSFDVRPEADAYYFARVLLEDENTRLLSAPIFIDR